MMPSTSGVAPPTSPTVSSSPSMNSSTSTLCWYAEWSWTTAERSSSKSYRTLLLRTPLLEPSKAGLTNTGNVSSAACAAS